MPVFAYNPFRAIEFYAVNLLREIENSHNGGSLRRSVSEVNSIALPEVVGQKTIAVEKKSDVGNTLMLALQRGDQNALQSLFDLYNDRLFNFTLRIVGDSIVAEDLIQETWLSLYENRERYRPTYRFSTWLFTIARRKALSELRRRKVRSIVRSLTPQQKHDSGERTEVEIAQETFRQPDVEASGAILSEVIEKALGRLTPSQREIIVLRDMEGLENEEVAKVLNWNLKPGAIRKRVFDAREAFRKAMIELGVEG